MDTSFKYKPLSPEKNEIRLISIAPGLPSDGLKGRLFHVILDQAPKYDALSYCWADAHGTMNPDPPSRSLNVETPYTLHDAVTQVKLPPSQGHISVNGQAFQLTANLEAALRRLRPRKDELVIWVDAVCIDQSNTKERNEQVGKMRLIYHGAEIVRVWLGESYDESAKVFGFVRKLSRFWLSGSVLEGPFAKEACKRKDLESMASLFERAYWHRVWVVQEVAMARRAVVHCGPDIVTWFEILNALLAITENFSQIVGGLPVDVALMIKLQTSAASCFIHSGTTDSADRLPRYELENLLLINQSKQATDPKDKVFALIGISGARDDPKFVLDYFHSLRKVFTNVVEYLMVSTGSLNIISIATVSSTIPDLPSWVPDWTSSTGYSLIVGEENVQKFQGRKSDASISPNQKTLTAHGFCIDIIDHLGRLHTSHQSNIIETLKTFYSWQELVIDLKGRNKEDQALFMRSTYHLSKNHNSFDMSLYLGALASLSQALLPERRMSKREKRINKGLKAYMDRFRPEDRQKLESMVALGVGSTMENRCLFITRGGKIGTASNAVEIGDGVCDIFGCAYLVVLRAKDDGYVVVGDAYIDGLGVREAEKDFEKGIYEEEIFNIR